MKLFSGMANPEKQKAPNNRGFSFFRRWLAETESASTESSDVQKHPNTTIFSASYITHDVQPRLAEFNIIRYSLQYRM
jgi:hypothetical protein